MTLKLFYVAAFICLTKVSFAQEEPKIGKEEVEVLPTSEGEVIEEKTGCIDPPAPVLPPPPPKIKPSPKVVQSEVIDFPDVQSRFPGDKSEYDKWMSENLQYPEASLERKEEGKVYLSFVVEIDGSITNVKVRAGVSEELDSEAKRLVRIMPNWTPGEAGGKKVRTLRHMHIEFKLPEE